MFDDLKGKAVLITGSSTGIGAGAARAFGACGARVGVHYNRSEKDANGVAEDVRAAGGEAVVLDADVSKGAGAEDVVKRAADAFGRLDVLINNAGSMIRRAGLLEADEALFDETIDVNVRSVVFACRAAIPIFQGQGRGNIINTSSIAARLGGSPRSSLYSASKGFVSTFTRAIAVLALAALFVAPLAGCRKAAEEATEAAVEQAIEDAADGEVEVDVEGDEDGGSVTITGEDGEMTIQSGEGASVPDGFPDDVPLFDGQVTGSTTVSTEEGTVIALTVMIDDTADDAAQWFEDELASEGWETTFNMDNSSSDMRTVSFVVKKGDRNLTITIVDDGESVVVSYSVLSGD